MGLDGMCVSLRDDFKTNRRHTVELSFQPRVTEWRWRSCRVVGCRKEALLTDGVRGSRAVRARGLKGSGLNAGTQSGIRITGGCQRARSVGVW